MKMYNKLVAHCHLAAAPYNHANHARSLSARRHEVDQGDSTIDRFEVKFLQNKGFPAITPGDACCRIQRPDDAAAVLSAASTAAKHAQLLKARP